MGGRGGSARSSAEGPAATQAPAAEANLSPGPSTVADRAIRAAWEREGDRDAWVGMEKVRAELANNGITDRQQQTEEIKKFVRARKGVAIPQSNQKVMTDRRRDAAVTLGNEQKTLLKVLRD